MPYLVEVRTIEGTWVPAGGSHTEHGNVCTALRYAAWFLDDGRGVRIRDLSDGATLEIKRGTP